MELLGNAVYAVLLIAYKRSNGLTCK